MWRLRWRPIAGAAVGIMLAEGYRLHKAHDFHGWHGVLAIAETLAGALTGGLAIEFWRMRRARVPRTPSI